MEEASLLINSAVLKKSPIFKVPKKLKKLRDDKSFLKFLDCIISTCVVGPLCVIFWRGTWEWLMLHTEDYFPIVETLLLSLIAQTVFTIIREVLQYLRTKKCKTTLSKFFGYILDRMYTYVFAVVCIMHWKSQWDVFDKWFGIEISPIGIVIGGDVKYIFLMAAISLVILLHFRTVVNSLGVPFCIDVDFGEDIYDFPTRFRVKVRYFPYFLNCKYDI